MATEKREYKNVFWVSKAPKPATDPEQFKLFHELTTKNDPEKDYWYLPLGRGEVVIQKRKTKDGKVESVATISGKDPLVYGKWKDEEHRLTFEQAYQRLKEGFNVGVAAKENDHNVILDVDDMDLVGETKPTLQATSRKRLGRHNYYITEEPSRGEDNPYVITANDNIPLDDAGELRSNWLYVVAPGSFVPCGPTEYSRIPAEDRCNAGKYSILNPIEPANITFNELPEIFKNKRIRDIQAAIEKEQQKLQRPKQDDRHSNSRLFELTAGDVLGYTYNDYEKFPSPLHGSSTGANASFTGPLLHCWRHTVSHSGYSLLAVLAGLYDCGEAGTPHKHAGVSYLKYDGEEIFSVWKYAKEHNHIPDEDPIPTKALVYYATYNDICKESDITDGWKLPADAYNRTLAVLREADINPGRAPIGEEKEQKPIDWKTPLKQAVMDTQDADPETQVKAATDILRNVLATMPPIPRKETFLSKVCPELKISNRAANDIYKKFEHDIHISSGAEWFNDRGKFVPSVMSNIIREKYNIITLTDTNDVWTYDPSAGFWKMGGDVIVKQFAQRALDLHSKKSLVEETLYHIMNETYENRGVFNTEPDCINLKNGIYNLPKNTFSDHSPEGMFTFALPFNYNPDAECIKFDRFLEQCDVNKTLIYEIFAYCLVAGYPIQSFFIFLGDGGNGKGTAIRVLRKFLGEENITGHSMQAFDTNRYAKADLFGKLANICGDMPPKRVTDTSPIKNISGGDAITAPVIYKGNITFENRAKPIFLLNHMPEFDDDTDSFDRRMVVQEFNNRVVGLDPDFNEADMWTEEELSGIFNHCLRVLPDLLQRGSFTGQMNIEETKIYRQRKGNIIQAFVDDCTYLSEYETVESTHVYAAFVRWCTENHETVMSDKQFGRKLKESLPEIKRYRTGTGKDRKYMYKGLRLDDGYDELDLVEELDKYENSKNNRTPPTPKTSLEESPSKPHQNPIKTPSKKSDLSDTIATKEGKDPIKSDYVVQKKNKSKTPGKSGESENGDNFMGRGKEGLIGDLSPKKATDTEKTEIFDRGLIGSNRVLIGSNLDLEEQTSELIEDCLDKWELSACPIFAKNAHKAKLDIVKYHKMYGINPQLIHDAVDRRAAGRCVDCGSDTTNNVSQDGRRCKPCHDIYSNPPPVVIPEEFSLEDPAEVTP